MLFYGSGVVVVVFIYMFSILASKIYRFLTILSVCLIDFQNYWSVPHFTHMIISSKILNLLVTIL